MATRGISSWLSQSGWTSLAVSYRASPTVQSSHPSSPGLQLQESQTCTATLLGGAQRIQRIRCQPGGSATLAACKDRKGFQELIMQSCAIYSIYYVEMMPMRTSPKKNTKLRPIAQTNGSLHLPDRIAHPTPRRPPRRSWFWSWTFKET